MKRFVRVLVMALVLAAAPQVTLGAGSWQWPVEGDVALPYGAPYVNEGGATCTHGGLDLTAAPGSNVRACAAGAVSFAGKVPAGQGRQAYAVTISCADGLRVTYLPLRDVRIRKGQVVEAGSVLGTLDPEGDASSGSSHLHLGVKRGEAQLDPTGFLIARDVSVSDGGADIAASTPAAQAVRDLPTVTPGFAAAPFAAGEPVNSRAGAASRAAGAASASAPSLAPGSQLAIDCGQLVRNAARVAADAITDGPELARISAVAESPSLDLGRMVSDIGTGRGALGGLLLRLGLAVAGAACVAPVVRGARRAAGTARLPVAIEPVRRTTR